MKLSTRIFALAFVNLVLLAGVFVAFAHYQFHLNLTSLLVAPAEDRVRDVARSVASDLAQTPVASRTNLMARYAATYGVDFYVFDNDGPQLAGKPVQLPAGVKRELMARAPNDQPPPPRADAPPPRQDRPLAAEPPPPRADRPPPRGDRPPPRGDGPPPPPRPEDDNGEFPPPPGRGFGPPPRGGPNDDQRGPGAPDDFAPPRAGRPPPPRRQNAPLRSRLSNDPFSATGGSIARPFSATGGSRVRPFSATDGSRARPFSATGAASGGLRPRPSAANAGYQTMQRSEAGLYWAMTRIPVIDPAGDDLVRGTLVMAAPSFWGTPLFFDFKPWLMALAAAITVCLVCWLPFVRGLSRSISRLTVNTGRIAQGDFENHLPENRRDEIGQLSVSINRLAGRLGGFVTGQKRFLGDIAHELSAPIARIQFALGILDQRATEDQREAVEDLREEIGHMSGLVGELLSFSKAGLEGGRASLVMTDIGALVQQAVARERVEGVRIEVEISEPFSALVEPNLLLRALCNLLRNAVRYAGADGPITISAVGNSSGGAVIAVADCGPGLPAEELDRVFTPFYRLDTSRNRGTGGAGLGLAIVKSCLEASNGTVECRNREPHGLEVVIRLGGVIRDRTYC